MAKVIPIALAAHYAQPNVTLCQCLKVQRADSAVFGLTTLDQEITVDGVLYLPGLDASDIVSQSGLAVDNLELTLLKPYEGLSDADLLAGLWNGATFTVFEVNYRAPADGVNVLKRGTTGEAQVRRGVWVMEFRGLTQALQQPLGQSTSKTCRYRLGSVSEADGGLCLKDLTAFTYTSTVTSVASRQVFTDTVRTDPDEWFAEGLVEFLTGDNAGYSQKVKLFAAGMFTLALPMPFNVVAGDIYTAIAGCQKRLTEDCKLKFANVLNFGGEPHLGGIDGLVAVPEGSA